MNSIFVLRYYKQDVDKGDKVVCLQYKYTQIHQDLFPKMWKQVLVWGLNAVLIVAVGVAWVLVGDRQGTRLIERNGEEGLNALGSGNNFRQTQGSGWIRSSFPSFTRLQSKN